jgi:CBS domain-containing protein
MLVDNILQAKGTLVHTLPATASISEAVDILNAHNIGAVVVTDENNLVVGILSERDVVRQLGGDPAHTLSRSVGDCMSSSVITCSRDTDIAMVMERMTTFRIRHIPVIENGDLVGIVSIGDVVKRKIEEAEQEASALRDYIASGVA